MPRFSRGRSASTWGNPLSSSASASMAFTNTCAGSGRVPVSLLGACPCHASVPYLLDELLFSFVRKIYPTQRSCVPLAFLLCEAEDDDRIVAPDGTREDELPASWQQGTTCHTDSNSPWRDAHLSMISFTILYKSVSSRLPFFCLRFLGSSSFASASEAKAFIALLKFSSRNWFWSSTTRCRPSVPAGKT
eukprot:scaffold4850_cov213-Pinguiococcus_pyrenoidosus.AAC.15